MATDPELLRAAITAAGLTQAGFAVDVLGVDPSTVRRWLSGVRGLDPTVRKVCAAVIARPKLARELAAV